MPRTKSSSAAGVQELQRASDSAPTSLTRLLSVEDLEVAGMVVRKVRPRLLRPRGHVNYVHGGGDVHLLTDYWRLVRALAKSTRGGTTRPFAPLIRGGSRCPSSPPPDPTCNSHELAT
jgi:hypothetical protein